MEGATGPPGPSVASHPHPDVERIRQQLLHKGVYPSLRAIRSLRRKELRKARLKVKLLDNLNKEPRLSRAQELEIARESHFQKISREYKEFCRALHVNPQEPPMVGKPWESVEMVKLKELASANAEYCGDKLNMGHLRDLSDIIEKKRDELKWLLEDDIEVGGWSGSSSGGTPREKKPRSMDERIGFLVSRLSTIDVGEKDWKFVRLMKLSAIEFNEDRMMDLLKGLSIRGQWRPAIAAVKWVYRSKQYIHSRSRTVFTKLLMILRKARRPHEALHIFYTMLGDSQIYPDVAAYQNIAVALGQAGLLKELINIVGCMRQDPTVRAKYSPKTQWKEVIEPDLLVYNSILNACVSSHQWKGVAWVFQALRKSHIRPNGATYGLAMEVMLHCGKYDLVSKFFLKMQSTRRRQTLTAITYRVLVKALWKQGKVDSAVLALRDMEARGIMGIGSVYFVLACCLCNYGRWKDAMFEIENLRKVPHKDLAIAFTGMINSAAEGGHIHDCISIFEEMKYHCERNIGCINVMLRVYGKYDMFSEAKMLFENTKNAGRPAPTAYTYSAMLETSASAQQWEYFEYVYREMALTGLQLNKIKHGFLLVEASRAGKSHLLEHSFDLILECGGIPPFGFFVELMCHATAHGQYERAVSLANALAYASYEVDEDFWTDLFTRNRERLGTGNLEKLRDALSDIIVDEATFKNLVSSLRSVCGPVGIEEGKDADISDYDGSSGGDDDDDEIFDLLSLRLDEGDDDDDGCNEQRVTQSSKGSDGDVEVANGRCDDDDELPAAEEILAAWSGQAQGG